MVEKAISRGVDQHSFDASEQQRRIDSLIQDMERWAAVVPNSPNLEKYLDQINMQAVNSSVLPFGLKLLCDSSFPVLDEPAQHDYSDFFTGDPEEDEQKISHALHHVDEHEIDGHKLWLHDLRKGLHTSTHSHDKIEIQRALWGRFNVGDQTIFGGQTHIVAPGNEHPAITVHEPAIMLCVLMDGAGEASNKVHKFRG